MTQRTRRAAVGIGASAVAAIPTGVLAASYVVRPGDTLFGIAALHGTSARSLVDANKIANANHIGVGHVLSIPDAALKLPGYVHSALDTQRYVIQRGDTLYKISRAFDIEPGSLARANGLRLDGVLHPGTVLQVPGRLTRINSLLTNTAKSIGVEPKLVRAVAWEESSWQQHVVSPTGAIGLMQIEPYTGNWVSHYLAGRTLNLHDAADNVEAGALLLHHLLDVHSGDIGSALAGYYQGDSSIARHGLYQDTLRYQREVLSLMRRE
ncbi:MAG TPA: LysM peptidoglycan-binding domain-containing protein [Candidatus Sulfotelmatobacter sp.]|nr:LysM peptidoglycan-binding domain-containing protein [Candidatus Sulfotelmatobacter sp.]